MDRQKNFFFGFSTWGVHLLKGFFKKADNIVADSLADALSKGLDRSSRILMYPTKKDQEVLAYAQEHHIATAFVEDGFIRSLTLGSSFFKPASIVLDERGIYYDPSTPSDLEHYLNTYRFDEVEIERAKRLKSLILEQKISKYNHQQDRPLSLKNPEGKKVILAIGQVDDDMSIQTGGYGFDSFSLVKKTRELNPQAYIIYKPHPDVLGGIRVSHTPIETFEQYADEVIYDATLDSCFDICDEVHTITSLSGFEALLRGKQVHTYGMPFYAGWGVTIDYQKCIRRNKTRSVDEILYAAYILYPEYVSLENGESCEVEDVIMQIAKLKKRYRSSVLYRMIVNTQGSMAVLLRKLKERFVS